MKKLTLLASLVVAFFIFSCQKESSQEEGTPTAASQKEAWLTANLDAKFAASQKQVTAYLFPTSELAKLVQTPNVTEVRFVLGYADNTLQIQVDGVDKAGKKLGSVNSSLLKESAYDAKLATLKVVSDNTTKKRSALLKKHLLVSKEAFGWIDAWQNKLSTVKDLEEVTSYDGLRIRHFNLEAEVVAAMLKKNTANIGVFLGLNTKGKVTTILVGLDKNNAIKKASLTAKDPDDVYDGTRPSPPY